MLHKLYIAKKKLLHTLFSCYLNKYQDIIVDEFNFSQLFTCAISFEQFLMGKEWNKGMDKNMNTNTSFRVPTNLPGTSAKVERKKLRYCAQVGIFKWQHYSFRYLRKYL